MYILWSPNHTLQYFFEAVLYLDASKRKEEKKNKKNSISQLLFTRPRLELHIKDCASHQSQAAVGVGGGVHGYKIIVTYAGLASEV